MFGFVPFVSVGMGRTMLKDTFLCVVLAHGGRHMTHQWCLLERAQGVIIGLFQ